MKKILSVLTLSLFLAYPVYVWAQSDDAQTPQSKEWKDMSESEKAAKKAEFKEKWKNMTPEQQEEFKQKRHERLKKRYDNATPEQQQEMRDRARDNNDKRTERDAQGQ